MRIVADLHIHSKYSRATSARMDVAGISEWAVLKGIDIVGSGDFTHPKWLAELRRKLETTGNGFFSHGTGGTNFILSAEVSNIFEHKGETKKIHTVLLAPSFEIAEQINDGLAKFGDLSSDGRPILSNSASETVEIATSFSREVMVIPAHIWTPWFSLFGSKSGFDSIEECYGDMSGRITALETGLSCYDSETEVLTGEGWKKIGTVKLSDSVCTIDPTTSKIEYQRPISVFRYPYKGKMYRLKTKRVDILVTPNHNLFYSPCDFRNPKPYSLREARDLFGKSKRFKKDGIWQGNETRQFVLPSIKIKHGSRHYSGYRTAPKKRLAIGPWLKFFGFWLAEGWTTRGKNGDYNVCVCNSKRRLLLEMKGILTNLGYNAYINGDNLRVRDFQLFNYLRQFGNSREKHVPIEIKSLSKGLLQIMFDYYIKGDGHRYGRTNKGLSATTISERLRDDLQEIALKMGMSAYYKLGYKKGTPFRSPGRLGKTYLQSADSWIIFFIRRNQPIILPSTIKKYHYTEAWKNYDGEVFCVSVPNRVIYVRRNGVPLWCGNSDPAMNWRVSALDKYALVSNSDAHSPEKLGREANVFDFGDGELSYGAIADAIKNKDPSRFKFTYEFYPEEGKYHWDGHRSCGVSFNPMESSTHKNICPVCGRPLTLGVLHRVEALADRPDGFVPKGAIPFKKIVPLQEIIAASLGKTTVSIPVRENYGLLVRAFGNEFAVLDANPDAIKAKAGARIAEAIKRVQDGTVCITPGYDGVFGKVGIFEEKKAKIKGAQSVLSSFDKP
ncbi:MAG: hypothetical protein NT157_03615 [Candidatus Micrarchaeota archaeon]|nr:hypothetical protein [Candidatus Micrarchaeota archaeon]